MKTIQVKQMTSNRSGNPVANQFIIETKDAFYFQSYRSLIAKVSKRNGKIYLDSFYWDYSRTTSKYLYQFIQEFRGCFVGLSKKKIIEMANNKNYSIYFKNLN